MVTVPTEYPYRTVPCAKFCSRQVTHENGGTGKSTNREITRDWMYKQVVLPDQMEAFCNEKPSDL